MSKEASLEKSVGKELSIEQDKYLKDLYYDKPFPFGRDKLFAYVKYLHTLKKIIPKLNCLEDKLTFG